MYVSKLQIETIDLISLLLEQDKTFDEIRAELFSKHGYQEYRYGRNGYVSKTEAHFKKDGEETFVTLKKRRDGLALLIYDWVS